MFGSMPLRAAKACWASASKALLAVVLSVVLTISLTPTVSWAVDSPEEQPSTAAEVTPSDGVAFSSGVVSSEDASKPDAPSTEEPAAPEPEPTNGLAASNVASGIDSDDAPVAPLENSEPSAQQPVANVSDANAAKVQANAKNAQLSATVSFIGVDAEGNDLIWAAQKTYRLDEGTTADVLTEKILSDASLSADYGTGDWGWYLNSVVSPVNGVSYGYDDKTGKYWQLFVNGVAASTGASGVTLQDGDVVTWYYSTWGASLPEGDLPSAGEDEGDGTEPESPETPGDDGSSDEPSPDRPDYDSAWPGYAANGAGALKDVATPTAGVETAWTSTLKPAEDWSTSVSDPIVVNGNIYIVVGDTILCKDSATGETLAQATLAAAINSTARIVYADGLVIVPLAQGRLQALTADTLKTVWTTDALPQGAAGDQQPLTTLTVSSGCVYYGTASADWSATYGGFFLCVDLETGRVTWSYEDVNSGFYWAGAAVSGSFAVIANDQGVLRSFAADGSIAGTLDLGVRVRSTVVADGSALFVVSSDGVLHKIVLAADGSMKEAGSVAFGSSSTTTPVLADGKVIVTGASTQSYVNAWGGQSYYGVLAVIDAATMEVEQSITMLTDGSSLPADSKSAPLVSIRDGKTYVYFTCNSTPGGVYRYCVGDAAAQELYVPESALQNYCMASIVADANGNLYYTNDSGTLFALKGVADSSDPGSDGDSDNSGDNGNNGEDSGEKPEGSKPDAPSQDEKPGQNMDSSPGGSDVPGASSNDDSAQGQGGRGAAGVIAAGHQPLGQAAFTVAEDAGTNAASSEEGPALALANGKDTLGDSGVGSEGAKVEGSGPNPLALAGLLAGLVGLLAIVLFLLKRRQSDN